jgi:hypothetical protein
MFHLCNKGVSVMVKSIWKKFHSLMKSGKLNKVIKISGIK